METGSKINNRRKGGDLNFVETKRCVLKVSETCAIKPNKGKWIYLNYSSKKVQHGEYLQPMLLNKIIKHNLYESIFSPRAGSRKAPAIYITNTNDLFRSEKGKR